MWRLDKVRQREAWFVSLDISVIAKRLSGTWEVIPLPLRRQCRISFVFRTMCWRVVQMN
jgi:hypothetical protein